MIGDNARIPPELALMIYSNNVSGTLIKVLAAAFPACRRILGESCFNGIARCLIAQCPSEHADLNRYGARFSDFLDHWTATRAAFSDYRYLGDLARLERYCHTAYYAADDPPFDFTAFARAGRDARDRLQFQLAHSLRLLESKYPLMEIRDANLSDGDAAQVRAVQLPEHLVVSRPALRVRVERIDAISFRILAACHDGMTLAGIANISSGLQAKLSETLPELIRRRWITGFAMHGRSTDGERSDA